jgi:nucleoside-diphosphate-sugar epimerase
LNLVWIDDVVKAIVLAFERGVTGVYNLSGTTMRRREFYDPLLSRRGYEPVQWQADPPALGRRVLMDHFRRTFEIDLKSVDPADLGEA